MIDKNSPLWMVDVDCHLIDIKNHERSIEIRLNDNFPKGSKIKVRLRENARPSIMTVLCCDGRGNVRAYMEGRYRRFVRDFPYTECKLISDATIKK